MPTPTAPDTILQPEVLQALHSHGLQFRAFACDPALADTAAFCEAYGFSLAQSANTIIVASRKTEPVRYAACVVLADSRLDVNKRVCQLMHIKRASFADGETTTRLTGMTIGGVTAIGITSLPVYIDSRVLYQTEVILGGGNRSSKVILHPQELTKLPRVQVVENLTLPKTEA